MTIPDLWNGLITWPSSGLEQKSLRNRAGEAFCWGECF
jgi:hypothetical protein